MTTIGYIIGIAIGAALLVALAWGVISWRRKQRRQARLDIAFARARTVGQTGSGLQGTPYSVYAESAWADHTKEGR